ncbi:MAG TPA: carboxypeptidase-like regulatory domain-containing protein [Pirellulales bacterium]|jgi:hypothetical protein|nr:carboxypeptidase-like regulatory domain-containing protein [Pirellulales bacterium]
MYRRPILTAGILGSFLATFGCNPAPKITTIAASGTVTYNGKPVEKATVTFFPADKGGRQAVGVTGSDGRFMLKTHLGGSTMESGAEANEYKVTVIFKKEPISPIQGAPPTDPEEIKKKRAEGRAMGAAQAEKSQAEGEAAKRSKGKTLGVDSELPAKYADFDTTPFTATVKAGEKNDFPFELKDD